MVFAHGNNDSEDTARKYICMRESGGKFSTDARVRVKKFSNEIYRLPLSGKPRLNASPSVSAARVNHAGDSIKNIRK